MNSLSIKKLTFLGFSLVALPLVLALLYSANQVNQLSKQGANAIFNVAELININRELSSTLKKMERYASQYLVLHDEDLLSNYRVQQQSSLATSEKLPLFNDQKLTVLNTSLTELIKQIHQELTIIQPKKLTTLEQLQQQFKDLIAINEQINLRSNKLINLQAETIKQKTEQISNNLLKSLFIIPISLVIAGIFMMLITKPLKQLIVKIQKLQQGNFNQEITPHTKLVTGFIEIKEINDALDTMRIRLHALELQKSSFIRHISHELKTPLAAIREGTELLYDNSVGQLNDEQQEITKIIRSSTTHLQHLIEELLNFNIVLDSSSLQDREKLNLSHLIDHVISDRTLDIKRKHLSINKEFSEIFIQSNAKQLMVVLDNLLSNAIKYSPEQGVITISAQLLNRQLELVITDQGTGIAKNQQNKIFDAFYQGSPPRESTIKSSGLGLTIVKELLMRLNGEIHLNSQTQAPSGTTMKVILRRAIRGDIND